MASAITPSSINATYPVAGVDNDSQGFRDNFSAIRSNFTLAKSEIEELQSGTAKLTVDNNFTTKKIQNATLQQVYETAVNKGAGLSGTVTFDFSAGGFQYLTTGGSVTFAFSNFPSTGKYARLRVEVSLTSGHVITFPASVIKVSGYTMPSATGKYLFEFATYDGGTTVTCLLLGSQFS